MHGSDQHAMGMPLWGTREGLRPCKVEGLASQYVVGRHQAAMHSQRSYAQERDVNALVALLGDAVDSSARLWGLTRNVAATLLVELGRDHGSVGDNTVCAPPDVGYICE